MRLQRLTVLVLALFVLPLGGCGTSRPPAHSNFDGAAYPPGIVAPGFTLHDSRARAVSLSDYHGRVVALAFLSSDCRTCALVAQQIRGALDELGSSPTVSTIFVSTDPRADTRARVTRFLAAASLSGRAVYLTGSPQNLERVWGAYHVRATEDGTTVLLIDRAGAERVAFGIEQITPEGLAHDIRQLEDD
jgi:cytochrome oxidase Cu insertion factor (SCO1/SenC/PrrC family)